MIAGSAASGSLALVVDGSLGIVGSGVTSGMAMTGATVIGHRLGRELCRRESKDAINAVLTERVSRVLWVILTATNG